MILKEVKLQNFKSYGELQTIDLRAVDAASIIGANGAGKSTIIEALTFALYGRSTATERKELGIEAIIRDGEDEALASVTFEKDGQIYTVERTARRTGSGKATLLSSSRKVIQAGMLQVSKRVESIVGMDYETFVSSTIIRQDEMDKISGLRPGDRKQILSKIFGLELYDKLKKNTHEKLVETKVELAASEQVRSQLSQTILNEKDVLSSLQEAEVTQKQAQSSITKSRVALEAVEVEIKKVLSEKTKYDVKRTHIESLEREIANANRELEETSEEVEEAKEAKQTLATIDKQIEGAKTIEAETEGAVKLRDEVNNSVIKLEQKVRHINQQITEEQDHHAVVKAAKTAECPVCKRPLDEKHRKKVLEQYDTALSELKTELESNNVQYLAEKTRLEKEILPKLRELERQGKQAQDLQVKKAGLDSIVSRLSDLVNKEKKLKTEIAEKTEQKRAEESESEILEKAVEEYDKLEKERSDLSERLAVLREKKAKLESIVSSLPDLIETQAKLNSEMAQKTKQKEEEESELKTLEKAVEEYDKLERQKTNLSERLAELREEKAGAESSIKHLKTQAKEISNAKAELEHLKSQSGEQMRAMEIYSILEDAFGKDGIPTAILTDLVPHVEEEASRILQELSNGRMTINFRFGRQTKGGTQTDELVIEAEDNTGVHPVTRFSGGERMRINLALRLGISEEIARRSGYKGKIETLIIDEGFGALDEEGLQATIEILRQLRQKFKHITIISHVDDVKDAFDTKLAVAKNPKGESIIQIA